MLQMDFTFLNVESIHGFTSFFVAIFSAISYIFGFPPRSKRPTIDILKLLVTTLSNQDKKVSFIRVDEDGELEISSEFMRTCHNKNITVQTKGGYASSLNVKLKSQIRNWLILKGNFYWTKVTIRNFGSQPIIMTYVSPAELRIGCVVMLLNYFVMD